MELAVGSSSGQESLHWAVAVGRKNRPDCVLNSEILRTATVNCVLREEFKVQKRGFSRQ